MSKISSKPNVTHKRASNMWNTTYKNLRSDLHRLFLCARYEYLIYVDRLSGCPIIQGFRKNDNSSRTLINVLKRDIVDFGAFVVASPVDWRVSTDVLTRIARYSYRNTWGDVSIWWECVDWLRSSIFVLRFSILNLWPSNVQRHMYLNLSQKPILA